jgi:hypothetical protein
MVLGIHPTDRKEVGRLRIEIVVEDQASLEPVTQRSGDSYCAITQWAEVDRTKYGLNVEHLYLLAAMVGRREPDG